MYKFIIHDIKTKKINTEKKEQEILIFEYWEYTLKLGQLLMTLINLLLNLWCMQNIETVFFFFLYFQELLNHAMYFIFYFLY